MYLAGSTPVSPYSEDCWTETENILDLLIHVTIYYGSRLCPELDYGGYICRLRDECYPETCGTEGEDCDQEQHEAVSLVRGEAVRGHHQQEAAEDEEAEQVAQHHADREAEG